MAAKEILTKTEIQKIIEELSYIQGYFDSMLKKDQAKKISEIIEILKKGV